MKQNIGDRKPNSFAETVRLVEDYVQEEIVKETSEKQLYYHTLNHAKSVKRRSNLIFEHLKPVLAADYSPERLDRLNCLIDLSATSHDMVQEFALAEKPSQPRKHLVGASETATADKVIEYAKNLARELSANNVEPEVLFSDLDLAIIQDAILATICDRDPQAGTVCYSFSTYSIYQPYLYNRQPKISLAGSIIALADLGALGIDGIRAYIRDGILIFLEDNLDLQAFVRCNDGQSSLDLSASKCDCLRTRLLGMNLFMVNLAKERFARLEPELADFTPEMATILKEQVFTHLNSETIALLTAIIPTAQNTTLKQLIDFYNLHL